MIFNRLIIGYLHKWKQTVNRKPLIVRGARQVGKTTVIKQFAKEYKNRIILNLEKAEDRKVFERYDNVKEIIEYLFLINNISIKDIKNTLLFIDEIQESPVAIKLLRYFYEDYSNLHVIAAGSMLEFALKNVKSFPVGRVEYMYLYPLNFLEYLEATGKTVALEQINTIPINKYAHSVLLELFNNFTIIGGMPEVIASYIDNNTLIELPKIYESIWSAYKDDVEKYSSSASSRNIIRYIMQVAPNYIDQRIKFQNFGNSNYKSREIGEAMRTLEKARIIKLIYPTTDVEIPLKANYKKSPKLQMLDTGIVNYTVGIQPEMIGVEDLNKIYKGAVIPHIINQELISLNMLTNKDFYFWVREKTQSSSEVDLVYQYRDKIIPVEIKSGATGTLRSLHQFINRVNHNYAVRMYAGEFNVENAKTPAGKHFKLMNVPYYLGTKLYEYIKYFIENY